MYFYDGNYLKRLLFVLIGSFFYSFALRSYALISIELPSLPPLSNLEINKIISKKDMEKLAITVSYIKEYYIKPVSNRTLVENAISGMLSKLDPHSDYLDASDIKELELMTLGRFCGIGVEVIPEDGAIRVVSPLDGTPAAKAGIKAKDLIVKIDDKLVKGISLRDAINMMRGRSGSAVILTVLRKGEKKPLFFKVKRKMISVKTVKFRMLEPAYGYIRIAFFQSPTEKDLVFAIDKLTRTSKKGREPLKGLILDLRNNPGGLLESAVQVADDFLDTRAMKDNKLIVYTKGQSGYSKLVINATDKVLLSKIPIVVLINEGSASAAEIVAGALRDHKRAVIVGTRSFGKGSVQTLFPLDEKSAIKLTTALYYTPSGTSIQVDGIEPDFLIEESAVLRNANEEFPRIDESNLPYHLKNDSDSERQRVQGRKNIWGAIPSPVGEKQLALAAKDYQLYAALAILKRGQSTCDIFKSSICHP